METRPASRPCGTFEKWYIARSLASSDSLVHVGLFLSIRSAISVTFARAAVHEALNALQEHHPWLTARLSDYDTPQPKIALTDNADPSSILSETFGIPKDDALRRELSKRMGLGGPLWRAVLFCEEPVDEHEESQKMERVYVGVTIHHLLADGLATLAVARSLVALLAARRLPPQPPSRSLPVPLEAAVSLRPSLSFLGSTIYKAVQPKLPALSLPFLSPPPSSAPQSTPFRGRISTAQPHPRPQQVHLLRIPQPTLTAVHALCRVHRGALTLTSAIHTLITLAITPLLSPAQHVESSIPMSLLPLFAPQPRWAHELGRPYDPRDGGVYAAPYLHSTLTHPVQPYPTSLPTTLAEFLALAQPTTAALHTPTARADAAQIWGIIGYMGMSTLQNLNAGNLKSAHDLRTFSFSNLGRVSFESEFEGDGLKDEGTEDEGPSVGVGVQWTPGPPVCALPANGLGAALVCGFVTSDAGEGAYFSLSWEEGVLETSEVEGIARRIEEGMERLAEWSRL